MINVWLKLAYWANIYSGKGKSGQVQNLVTICFFLENCRVMLVAEKSHGRN
jgi:hypothetical protein